jgi:RhtB (resistance to homoserine/threonine) family protein
MTSTSFWLLLGSVAAVNLLGAASPGPAFFVVSRTAVGQSRRAGLATGLGVSLATVIWAFGTIHGLALLIAGAAWLFRIMQAAGAAYLIYLGWQAIRHAAEPLPPALAEHGPAGNLAAFRRGFLTNMTNPKVAVFFASVFASVYGAGMPEWINLAVLGVIAIDEVVWYSLVALAFSSRPAQAAYGRAKRWIDRAFGAFLALFGIRLLWNLRLLAASP